MTTQRVKLWHIAVMLALLLSSFAPGIAVADDPPPGKPRPPASILALKPGDLSTDPFPLYSTIISTGFNSGEAFTPGFVGGQNGWTGFAGQTAEGHIDTANPASGDQHLRIAYDSSQAQGTWTGAFSPDKGTHPDPTAPSWVEVDVAISADGGADYHVIPQAPSQSLITTRVNFEYQGNIWVLDDDGSGGTVWVDTGVAWNVGLYTTLGIYVDPGADTLDIYYGGNLIYSGVSGVWAGTTIEQVVIVSDNYQGTDVGDFDNLTGESPTSIDLAKFKSRPTAASAPLILLFVVTVPGSLAWITYKRIAEQNLRSKA